MWNIHSNHLGVELKLDSKEWFHETLANTFYGIKSKSVLCLASGFYLLSIQDHVNLTVYCMVSADGIEEDDDDNNGLIPDCRPRVITFHLVFAVVSSVQYYIGYQWTLQEYCWSRSPLNISHKLHVNCQKFQQITLVGPHQSVKLQYKVS